MSLSGSFTISVYIVYLRNNDEIDRIESAPERDTILTAWFKLSRIIQETTGLGNIIDLRLILYYEVP